MKKTIKTKIKTTIITLTLLTSILLVACNSFTSESTPKNDRDTAISTETNKNIQRSVTRAITPDGKIPAYEWDQIMDNLYSRIHIHEWKNKYADEELVYEDGEEWKVELILDGRRIRTYRGENMYPPHWRMFVKIFRDLKK